MGSHVKKTSQQLECLLDGVDGLEEICFQAESALRPGGLEEERARVSARAQQVIRAGRTAVVYTSRQVLPGQSRERRRQFGAECAYLAGPYWGSVRFERKTVLYRGQGGHHLQRCGYPGTGRQKGVGAGAGRPWSSGLEDWRGEQIPRYVLYYFPRKCRRGDNTAGYRPRTGLKDAGAQSGR